MTTSSDGLRRCTHAATLLIVGCAQDASFQLNDRISAIENRLPEVNFEIISKAAAYSWPRIRTAGNDE